MGILFIQLIKGCFLNLFARKNNKMDKEKIFKLYMQWVDKVTEDSDWKTQFTPKEIVYKICEIIEKDI